MWIFAKDGFVSIKQHNAQPRLLVVRGRVKGDIERLMSCRAVSENTTGWHDYRYCAYLDRDRVADKIAEHVCAIRYENFKSAVSDKRRSEAYLDVWSRMDDLQWELSGEQQIAREQT
jgi:hypothetical protein